MPDIITKEDFYNVRDKFDEHFKKFKAKDIDNIPVKLIMDNNVIRAWEKKVENDPDFLKSYQRRTWLILSSILFDIGLEEEASIYEKKGE